MSLGDGSPGPLERHDHDRRHRRACWRLGCRPFEGHQRTVRRLGGDPRAGRGDDPSSMATSARRVGAARAAARGDLPRARERVGARDHPWASSGSPASTTSRSSLSEMQGRRTPGRGWIEGVLARRPTGVIAVFSDLSQRMRMQLRTRDIPFVVVDPTGEPLHDTPSIGATNWNGGLTATRHLLGLGHRRIGVIGGPERILAAEPGSMAIARRWTRPACRSTRRWSATAIPRRGGHREGPRPARARRPPDGDLRRQRPPGARGLPGRSRGATAHPGGPQRRRLRRPAGRALGRPAADDGPSAARRDGHGGRASWSCAWPAASPRPRRGSSSRRARHPREHRAAGVI